MIGTLLEQEEERNDGVERNKRVPMNGCGCKPRHGEEAICG